MKFRNFPLILFFDTSGIKKNLSVLQLLTIRLKIKDTIKKVTNEIKVINNKLLFKRNFNRLKLNRLNHKRCFCVNKRV